MSAPPLLLRAAAALGLAPRRTIDEASSEIAEEIAFHLEERARELEGEGLAPEDARARARELFGDVERTARECVRIQAAEGVMLKRIQWAVIAVLAAALGWLGWRHVALRRELQDREVRLRMEVEALQARLAEGERDPVPAGSPSSAAREPVEDGRGSAPAVSTADLAAKLRERPEDARHAWKTWEALLAVPPGEVLRILTELWPVLSVTQKQQALKTFAFRHGHPEILAILHLGATDASLEVQSWAFQYLREYSFRNFAEDYGAYLAWAETWRGHPLVEVLTENARAMLAEVWRLAPADLEQRLRDFEELDFRTGDNLGLDLARIFREAGALEIVEGWLSSPELGADGSELCELAFSWAKSLEPGEAWLRAHVLPFVHSEDEGIASGAIRALGDPANAWVVSDLLARLERTTPHTDASSANSADWSAATALAAIGDARVIPTLIGLIAANPGYNTVYGLGYFGLGKLTGVTYDESHDGIWWIDWWSKNQGRFPPEVRAIPIPQY